MASLMSDNKRRTFLKRLTRALGAGALSVAAPGIFASDQSMIRRMRVERDRQMLRLVFDVSHTTGQRLFQLTEPGRVVVDLTKAAVADGIKLAVDSSDLVQRLRYAPRNQIDLRIVLDVARQVNAHSFFRKTGAGHQFVVELKTTSPARVVVSPPPAAVPAPPAVVRKALKSGPLRDLVIAIDAGHGGKDPGAIGKKGTYEKDIVLQVARKLESLLKREPGFKPVMTRKGDYFLPLRKRIKKARVAKADLFISIHADAAENKHAKGSSVFVLSKTGASSEAARLLAEQENAVDLIGGVSLTDKDDMLASVLLDLSQTHTIDVSHQIAHGLLSELRKVGKVHSPRVEKAGFVVLKSPDIPSILVETAFISNAAEEKRLKTREYQQKIAKSLLRGIKNHFYQHAAADTLVSRIRKQQHTIRVGDTLSGLAIHYHTSISRLRSANDLKNDRLRVGQVLRIPVSDT